MNKLVASLLVALSCVLPACVAEPGDPSDPEKEPGAASPVSTDSPSNEEAVGEAESALTGSCASYLGAISTYYWTVKPLCAQGQQYVFCSIERQIDTQTPCRLYVCKDYVYVCNPQ